MPKVVTFSLFLPLLISSSVVWASPWPHQQQSNAASIFVMTPSFDDAAMSLRNSRGVHPDLVDAGARGDVQGLVVGVAELDVGDELGREDRAETLSFWRDDPHHARRRFPDVPLDVD